MNEGLAFALGSGIFALGYGLGAWISTRHRSSHQEIVVLDDFERSDGGVTLVTHVACAQCGEIHGGRLERDLASKGIEELRRAQAGDR